MFTYVYNIYGLTFYLDTTVFVLMYIHMYHTHKLTHTHTQTHSHTHTLVQGGVARTGPRPRPQCVSGRKPRVETKMAVFTQRLYSKVRKELP